MHLAVWFLDGGSVGSQTESTFPSLTSAFSFFLSLLQIWVLAGPSLATNKGTLLGLLATVLVLTAQNFRSVLWTLTVHLILLMSADSSAFLCLSLFMHTRLSGVWEQSVLLHSLCVPELPSRSLPEGSSSPLLFPLPLPHTTWDVILNKEVFI